jgi:hypothetical protein
MKWRIASVSAFACLTALCVIVLSATAGAGTTATGNGAPSGSHYTLNIIGVPQGKTADMTGNNGSRIFVLLNGGEDATSLNGKAYSDLNKVNTIGLVPAPVGESFQVLDANATDSTGALFQLPLDVSSSWTVWARALGTPGGSAIQTTCAASSFIDTVTGEIFCSGDSALYYRTKGKSTFSDVTSQLLFLNVTIDSTVNPQLAACLGVVGTQTVNVSLFNSCFQNYFWNYNNNGLKLLQLRFYAAS